MSAPVTKRKRTDSNAESGEGRGLAVSSHPNSYPSSTYARTGLPPHGHHSLEGAAIFSSSSNPTVTGNVPPILLPPINFGGPQHAEYPPPSSRAPSNAHPPNTDSSVDYRSMYGHSDYAHSGHGYGLPSVTVPPPRSGPPIYAAAPQQYAPAQLHYPPKYAGQHVQPYQHALSARPAAVTVDRVATSAQRSNITPHGAPEKPMASASDAVSALSKDTVHHLLVLAASKHPDISKLTYEQYEPIAEQRRSVPLDFSPYSRIIHERLYTYFARRHKDPSYNPAKDITEAMEGVVTQVHRESSIATKKKALAVFGEVGEDMLNAVDDEVGEEIVDQLRGDETYVSCLRRLLKTLTKEDIDKIRNEDDIVGQFQFVVEHDYSGDFFQDLDEVLEPLKIHADEDDEEDEDEDEEDEDEDEEQQRDVNSDTSG